MPDNDSKKFLFVVTYARSGSTLLQGILNAAKHIHCTGENGDFLHGLFLAYKTLEDTQSQIGKNLQRAVTEPFFGIDYMELDDFRDAIRHLIEKMVMASCSPDKNPQYLGIKEIRYPYRDDIAEYLEFIDKAFSQPVFIFLRRDLENVLSSGMFQDFTNVERDCNRRLFMKFEKIAEDFAAVRSNCTVLKYEWLTANPHKVMSELTKVGIEISYEEIMRTLKIPHSYTWNEKLFGKL